MKNKIRRIMFQISLTLVILLAGIGAIILLSSYASPPPQKPVKSEYELLLAQAHSDDFETATEAFSKIIPLLEDPSVPKDKKSLFIDAALARHRHHILKWREDWGDIIDVGYKQGLVHRLDYHKYLKDAFPPKIEIDPFVKAGPKAIEICFKIDGLKRGTDTADRLILSKYHFSADPGLFNGKVKND
jgi:hypothetical protein